MNYYKFIIGLLFFFLFQLEINAQYVLPNYQSQIVHQNELWLRWEPRSMEEWKESLVKGYNIKVYQGANTEDMTLIKEENIKPSTLEEWNKVNEGVKDSLLLTFYESAKNLVYTDKAIEEELMGMLSKEEGKSLEQTTTEFRLGYLAYVITYDFDLMKLAGLAYGFDVEKDKKYRIFS